MSERKYGGEAESSRREFAVVVRTHVVVVDSIQEPSPDPDPAKKECGVGSC